MMIGGDWKLLPWVRLNKAVSAPENPMVDTVFVSMHIQEVSSLSRMVLSSIKRGESVVLMPRRLPEVEEFRQELSEQGIPLVDWPLVQKGAVSIVSEFGKTKEVLAVSRTAVIGGSFARGLGVHDFWEPLQSGVSTCVGPYAEGQKRRLQRLYVKALLPSCNRLRNILGAISRISVWCRRSWLMKVRRLVIRTSNCLSS